MKRYVAKGITETSPYSSHPKLPGWSGQPPWDDGPGGTNVLWTDAHKSPQLQTVFTPCTEQARRREISIYQKQLPKLLSTHRASSNPIIKAWQCTAKPAAQACPSIKSAWVWLVGLHEEPECGALVGKAGKLQPAFWAARQCRSRGPSLFQF